MTPEARIAAACDILQDITDGAAAEKTLTNWARSHRFAGAGDRAAIRDLVFDAIRCRRSYAWAGRSDNGRSLMIGALRLAGRDPAEVFTGEGYAPAVLTEEERAAPAPLEEAEDAVRLDCPDWLLPEFRESLGDRAEAVLDMMRRRAPVFLRINKARTDLESVQRALAADGIVTAPHGLSETALEVIENPRRVQNSVAYRDGLVELQDVASQAVVDRVLSVARGKSVLDYCAGGGGKALALMAGGAARVTAHDANRHRMKDIPARAERAGVRIDIAESPVGQFDVVLCDVPCSGSGAWRRQPEAKWRFTRQGLEELNQLQDEILHHAAARVVSGGALAYATCSVLRAENDARIAAFLADHPGWRLSEAQSFTPLDGGDGFFVAILESETVV